MIRIKYNKLEGNILGFYPRDIKYPNEDFLENDQIGFIEISDKKHQKILNKKCFVKDGEIKEVILSKQDIVSNLKLYIINKIKSESKKIILAKYSQLQQINVLMSQNSSDIIDMNSFIKKIRDQSNLLEMQIADMDLDQLNSFDPTSDDHWS